MRRLRCTALPTIALMLACSVSTAPPPQTPATETPATTPADGAPTEVADADTKEAGETAEDKEAKQKEEMQKRIAERLDKLEKSTAEKKARFTPELSAKVAKLTTKTHRNLASAMKKILASEHRTEGASDRDAHRHPMETMRFFGLTPKMKVFEVGQGAGWYTEILAPLLAKDGALYLAGYDGASDDPMVKFNARQTELFIEGGGPVYEKVQLVTQPEDPAAPINFGDKDSLDMILVVRMMHNVHRGKMWDRLLPPALEALKPGGVLGVVQHRAADGADPDETAPKGYVAEDWLIDKVEGYGFELDKKSDVNANPKDTKDYEKGVWTLPPVLAEGDKDKEKYTGIGESDRSTLKFVKPKK